MTEDYSVDELEEMEAEETSSEDLTSTNFDDADIELETSKSEVAKLMARLNLQKKRAKEDELDDNVYHENGVELEVCNVPDFKLESIMWLWENMLARGRLNLVFGKAGIGKSYFTAWLAAVVSGGAKFPDGKACKKGRVLIINVEDRVGDVIRPRILGQKVSDESLIQVLKIRKSVFTIEGCAESLKKIVAKEDYSLVILDPISAMMGTETESNNFVRHVLAHLNPITEESPSTCFVLVTHERKSTQNVSSGQDLILGSQGYAAACRVCLRMAEDPEDRLMRIIGVQKENCNMKFKHAYRCYVDENTGELIFNDCLPYFDMDSLLEKKAGRNKVKDEIEVASHMLITLLKDGPTESTAVKNKLRAAGFSEAAIHKARKRVATTERSETDKRKTNWKILQ